MAEPVMLAGAVVAGACCAGSVMAAGRVRAPSFEISVPHVAGAREWLQLQLDRAGWTETPQRVVVLSAACGSVLAAIALGVASVLAAAAAVPMAAGGMAVGWAAVGYALRSAVARRRTRLRRELAPLLELFVLELAGGGSAQSALGSVTLQVEGELAAELRRLLIASQVGGTASFEMRLRDYAGSVAIPELASLATVLTASREYGTGVTQGVRALAADLRRDQRRELIAHSRRALNHVLFPAAIGVLLPFLAILLFPAVSALQANLR